MRPRGFGIVEVVVGMAIISASFVALTGIARFSLNVIDQANLNLRAVFLLSEGIEAVHLNRDESWTNKIAPLSNGTAYYLSYSSGRWSVTATPQPNIDGVFTRTVTLYEVRRDGSDNIVASGGSVDSKTRKVTARATWSYLGRSYDESVSAYITDLFSN